MKNLILLVLVIALALATSNAIRSQGKKVALLSSLESTVTSKTKSDGLMKSRFLFPCEYVTQVDGWTYTPSFVSTNCTPNSFLGYYGADGSVSSIYDTSTPHRSISINFRVILVDSWDDETFKVMVDDSVVYSIEHSYLNSPADTCQNVYGDKMLDVRFGFNHTATSMNITFTSDLDQDSDDEGWGICDLGINLLEGYADANGDEIGTIKDITFRCTSPSIDNDWIYNPSYQNVTCGTKSFVGAYSVNATLSSILMIPHTHAGLIIHFYVALFDSWQGESFGLKVEGKVVYSINYTIDEDATSDTCLSSDGDYYEQVKVGVNHTASTVELEFYSTLDDANSDASWGICDLFIMPTEHAVVSEGYVFNGILKGAEFNPMSPEPSPFWAYVPKYNTVYCNSGYYVGPFGVGDSMSSKRKVVTAHKGIFGYLRIGFLDNWQGNRLTITADGNLVAEIIHTHDPTGTNTCGSYSNDKFTDFKFGFNHTAVELEVVISSDLDGTTDGTWVVSFVTLIPNTGPITSHGFTVGAVKDLTFSCAAPLLDQIWGYAPSFSTQSCSRDLTFVGAYSAGGFVNTSVYTIDLHRGIVMSFTLALFGSWQGETFSVYADDTVVYSLSYYTNDTNTSSCDSTGDAYNYVLVKFGFNHSAFALSLNFTSDLTNDDASWGICDVSLEHTWSYVYSSGGEFKAIKPLVFSCSAPAMDFDWAYSPSYQTTECSDGNTYLGGYGAANSIKATLRVPNLHVGMIISFKLAFFDSWNANTLFISADNEIVYSVTHTTGNSKKSCQSSSYEYDSVDITFGLNQTGSSIQLSFFSNLDEADDGAWGICDLVLTPASQYVDLSGNML